MMNPQGGLASLVAALQGGMQPDQAFGITQYLEQEQQQRMANRAERLGGLASLLTNAAGQGMPYGGAQALAEAQPGPAGPAVQNMLESLYPGGQPGNFEYQPKMNPKFPNEIASGQMPSPEEYQAQRMATQSPVYQPDPMAELQLQEQQANTMQAVNQASYAQDWPVFQTDMTRARAQGINPYDAYQRFVMKAPQNAALVASDPGTVTKIMEAVWGPLALQTAGAPQG